MLTLRAIGISLLVAVVCGTLVGTALMILLELPIRLDLDRLADAFTIGVVASAVFGVPLGIVGGLAG